MLSLILALLLLPSSEGVSEREVVCQPTGQIENHHLVKLGFQCAGDQVPDPDGLQTYLDEMLALMPDEIALPRESYNFNTDIRIVYRDAVWVLPEPTPLIQQVPSAPTSAIESNFSVRCALLLWTDHMGATEIGDIQCERFRNRRSARATDIFEREIQDALNHYTWLAMPGAPRTCHETNMKLVLEGHDAPEAPIANAPACPQPP